MLMMTEEAWIHGEGPKDVLPASKWFCAICDKTVPNKKTARGTKAPHPRRKILDNGKIQPPQVKSLAYAALLLAWILLTWLNPLEYSGPTYNLLTDPQPHCLPSNFCSSFLWSFLGLSNFLVPTVIFQPHEMGVYTLSKDFGPQG